MLCFREDKENYTFNDFFYKLYPNTENLNDTKRFIWLMTTEDPNMHHLLQHLLSSLSEERIIRLKL